MKKVIPTVFAKNKKEFKERFRKLIELKRGLHIDFMDGRFIKAKGMSVKDVPDLKKYGRNFEAHLMCSEPVKYVRDLKKKGFKKVIFHYEAVKDINKILGLILYAKSNGLKGIIAVNPNTKINKLKDLLKEVDSILLMGVYPGKEKQKFISKVYDKIRKLRNMNKKIKIQVDGGVNLTVAKKLRKLKVNIVNTGSFVSKAENPKEALRELERVFR